MDPIQISATTTLRVTSLKALRTALESGVIDATLRRSLAAAEARLTWASSPTTKATAANLRALIRSALLRDDYTAVSRRIGDLARQAGIPYREATCILADVHEADPTFGARQRRLAKLAAQREG